MAIAKQDVEGFFTEYGRALGSRDAKSIATQHKDDRGNTVGGESGHYMRGKQHDRLSIHVYAPKTA